MASRSDSLQNTPNFMYAIVQLKRDVDATEEEAGKVIKWATSLTSAQDEVTRLLTNSPIGVKFAIFECAQVSANVMSASILYQRRV